MAKEIQFKAWSKYAWEVAPKPFPASQAVPQWWKNVPPYTNEENSLRINNRISNVSFKKCTPMLDSLISGYIIPLWSDVLVNKTLEGPSISWRVQHPVFEMHGNDSAYVERPPGYYPGVLKYASLWVVTTPPGYSILVTSPYGYRGSSPFKIIDAIIDSDKTVHDLTIPCWITEGFEGVVERGTPIAQIIPFKREDWKSTFDYYEEDEYQAILDRTVKSTIVNNYLKHSHSKKTYK